MKHLYIPVLAVALMLSSCYEDLSTVADKSYPDIVVASEGDILNVSYGDEFSFCPEVTQEGYTNDDFEFLWEIDMQPNRFSDRIELGTEHQLDYKVGNMPSNNPYMLTLKVINTKLGFGKLTSWKFFVSSSLGEGLLVAHTRDGGKSSELDLMSAVPVTYGYNSAEPHYTRNLYGFANEGKTIDGTVNQMTARVTSDGGTFNTNRIVFATDGGIFTIDPLTFKESQRDGEMFYNSTETDYATQAVFNLGIAIHGAIVNHRYYAIICNGDNNYSLALCNVNPNNFFDRNNTSYAKWDQGAVCTFNPADGKFYYLRGWQSVNGGFAAAEGTLSFDATDATCLGAGALNQLDHGYIIKDKTGAAHFCIVKVNDNKINDYSITGVNLDDVVACGFCDNANIAYLATPGKIYSLMLSGDVLVVSALSWKPEDSDEAITSIEQYQQGWYGTQQIWWGDYEFPLSTNRMQVIITTYNATTGEGKIYLRPFNINTGKFTYSSNGVYGGFGEITAVTATLR